MEASPENCFFLVMQIVTASCLSGVLDRSLRLIVATCSVARYRPIVSGNSRDRSICKRAYQTYQQQ